MAAARSYLMALLGWLGTGLGAVAIIAGDRTLAFAALLMIVGPYVGDWLARRT